MSQIQVDICRPGPHLEPLWADLIGRATANAFMAPSALQAASDLSFADIHVLLAWRHAGETRQLVGWWALQERAMGPALPRFLMAPPFRYAFVADPVVQADASADVIPAFLQAIERAPALPKLLRLQYLDAECEAARAWLAMASNGSCIKLSERQRPFASPESNLKKSGSTRKKLRQDYNRLAALGTVEVLNDRNPAAALAAFETFLQLESKSWKGAKGTALLSSRTDSAFVRALAQNMAQRQEFSVALLQLGGRAIAAQVLLYSGSMAYTWKTAFDSEFAKYSPGALLIEKMTTQLLALPNLAGIESCSPEGGFMEQLWEGRRSSVDLLVHVGQRKSFALDMLAHRERAYRSLKNVRKKVRSMSASLRLPGAATFAALTRVRAVPETKG